MKPEEIQSGAQGHGFHSLEAFHVFNPVLKMSITMSLFGAFCVSNHLYEVAVYHDNVTIVISLIGLEPIFKKPLNCSLLFRATSNYSPL